MSGLSLLQQGPFGVVTAGRSQPATASRPPIETVDADQGAGAGSGTPPRQQIAQLSQNAPTDGSLVPVQVAPATLFATSLLAPSIVLSGGSGAAARLSGTEWAPPSSSLTLRDRSV